MNFQLTKEQLIKLKEWKDSLPYLSEDSVSVNGGGYSFIFIPTSIGELQIVERVDGHKINLTNFEEF